SAMKLSFGQPDQTFESICRGLAMTCFTLGNDERVPAAGSMGYGPGVHFALSRIHRDTAGRMVRHSEAMMVGVLAPDIRGEQFTYERLTNSSRARIMVDTGSYDRIVARHKPYFAILLIAAHLWWVLGGISLLHWHRKRLA